MDGFLSLKEVSSQKLAAEMARGQVAIPRSASFPLLEVNAMTGISQILAVSAFLCLKENLWSGTEPE